MSAAFASAPTLRLTSPIITPASSMRTRLHRSDHANVHRAAAPIGRAGAEPPYLCNGFGLRRRLCSTRPLRLTSPTSAPASTFCMRPRLGSRTDLPALPGSPPAPRSEPQCNILPPYCSAADPGSEARHPEPLASRGLLHGVRSCTSSPELPPVAYQIDALLPTPFGGRQRR